MFAVIDMDFPKYAIAAVGEKKSIVVSHTASGRVKEFANRSEFYGRDKNKSGGWLGELNSKRDSPFTLDEFTIEDKVVLEPVANILHSAKLMVDGALKAVGATGYIGYFGEGDSFRVNASTLQKYKDRDHLVKPHYLEDVVAYLKKKYKHRVVRDLEADDWCVIEAYKNPNKVIIGNDKDYYGNPVKFFNLNKPEQGIVDCSGFGNLEYKTKTTGIGRKFLYHQLSFGDTVDTYKAHAASDVRWGDKSAFDVLNPLTTDKECLESIEKIYQRLYPQTVQHTTWKGQTVSVDWKYALEEILIMARMRRWEDDDIKWDQFKELILNEQY